MASVVTTRVITLSTGHAAAAPREGSRRPGGAPRHCADASPEGNDGRQAATPDRTILVIDDDPAILRMVRLVLRDEGFEVLTAENGVDALELLTDDPPHLIVLDLEMPVMDGRTFFRELRTRGHDCPVVILSAFGASRARSELGAEAAVNKPFQPDSLVREVMRLLALG